MKNFAIYAQWALVIAAWVSGNFIVLALAIISTIWFVWMVWHEKRGLPNPGLAPTHAVVPMQLPNPLAYTKLRYEGKDGNYDFVVYRQENGWHVAEGRAPDHHRIVVSESNAFDLICVGIPDAIAAHEAD